MGSIRFIVAAILSIPLWAGAQSNIVAAEYFFDTDPGVGAATALTAFTASPTIDVTFLASSSSLSQGMHILGIRVRDISNVWSIPVFLPVYIVANSPTIAAAEYFFDTDPGSGNATPISVTTGASIDVTFAANSSALATGIHVLVVRTRNPTGNWSLPSYIPFYIDRSRTITKLEYFFDTDPGSGNATTITLSPPTDLLDQIYSMNSSALALGAHTVNVRVAGQNNFWSIPESVGFTVVAALPPTITSFTPSSGLIGTTVTITGTNFDPIPANNTVRFNGTLATVTASTTTSITTTVPTGASTGPITVTVLSNTATSSTNFIVCPVPPVAVPNQGCENTSIIIGASGGSNGQYKWYTVATGGTAIAGEVNSSYTTPVLTATTTYYVSITVGGCESTRTAVIATVINTPSPTVTGANACPASTFALSASGGTNGQYRWYTVGAAIAGAVNGSYTTPALSTTTTYYVSIVNGSCESSRVSVTATVLATGCAPVITPQPLATQVEGKIVIDLVPLISTPGTLDVNSIKIVTQPTSGALATISSGVLTIDYTGRLFSGTESIGIEACNTNSLCSQQNFSIEVVGDIIIYNALSPNGDDKNPILFLRYIEVIPETKSNKVFIFNRWGDIVFEVENYDNVSRVFSGKNKNGDELPTGTYFYRIDFNNGLKSKTGFLSLRK